MTLNQCDKAFKEMIFDEMLISPNYEFKNTDKAFKVKINKNILEKLYKKASIDNSHKFKYNYQKFSTDAKGQSCKMRNDGEGTIR